MSTMNLNGAMNYLSSFFLYTNTSKSPEKIYCWLSPTWDNVVNNRFCWNFWLLFYCAMVVVNLILYQYLLELERKGCECSRRYRTELRNSIPVKVFFMVLEVICLAFFSDLIYANIATTIATLISWFVHFPLSMLFLWNANGRANPCDCARDWKELMTYICFF